MHSLLSGLWSLLTSALSFRKAPGSGSVSPSSPSGSSPASFTSPRSLSETGLTVLKHYEGCELKAYRDSVGVLTIGYGDTENVNEGMVITHEEAEDRLERRLGRDFEPAVRAAVIAHMRQEQFDAMVCLAYNIGAAAFAKSTLVKLFNAGDIQLAADQFLRWDKAGGKSLKGLRRRRAAERALFLGANAAYAIAAGDKAP
ncbi:Lysozyme RrrD [compost metagenome]